MAKIDLPPEQRGGPEVEVTRTHPEYQYLDLLRHLVEKGVEQIDKGTEVKTYSDFGPQMEFDLSTGDLPLLTTKKVPKKGMIYELDWFLKGGTNIRPLVENGVPIWNDYPYKIYRERVQKGLEVEMTKEEFIDKIRTDEAFAQKHGELLHIYGESWRRYQARDGREIDQLGWVLKEMTEDPDAHNLIVDSWRPEFMYGMAKPEEALRFPICHNMYQVNVQNGRVNLKLYQRSADIFLGLPWNIASYALLTHIIAHVTGNKPGKLIHTLGDVHIYENHIEQAKEQLQRIPRPFPKVKIDSGCISIDDFKPEHVIIENYNPYPPLPGELTVAGGFRR